MTGDGIEMQYYLMEHFVYWKSKEKTLFTLNICLLASLGSIPLVLIPIRYLMVAGLWGLTALSSPFFMAVGKAVLTVALEYAFVIERLAPSYIDTFLINLYTKYIPTIHAFLRWIPLVNGYIPSEQEYLN